MKEELLDKVDELLRIGAEIKEELESSPSITDDAPGEYDSHKDESNWLNRADAMLLTKKKTSTAFSNYYRRNEVEVRGSGADMKFYKPDLLNPRKKARRQKEAA